MKRVLILCTGNSCRSQLAEGYLRSFAKTEVEIYSAGIEVHGLNPKAIETMAADGVDISNHTSNHIDEYANIDFDYVITVCDHAKESCPYFPTKATKLHHNFPDPSKTAGTAEEIELAFVSVRNLIKAYCANFVNDYLSQ